MDATRNRPTTGDGEAAQSLAGAFHPARAQAVVHELSAARYAGRLTGQPGATLAAEYLVDAFTELGLAVSRQQFTAEGVPVFAGQPELRVDGAPGARALAHRSDFAEHPRSAYDSSPRTGVAVSGLPTAVPGSWLVLDAVPQGAGLAQLADAATKAGASGLLVPQFADDAGILSKRLLGGPTVGLPILAVRPDLLTTLAGATVTGSAPVRRLTVTGTNVLAEMPGSDPGLSNEPILITAHYDGVGDDPGQPFPAAGDNASGVAVLVEIARVLSQWAPRPARPVRFAALDAEEVGAQGSRAHASSLLAQDLRPTVLNLDMVGRLNKAVTVELGPGTGAVRDALDLAGRLQGTPLTGGPVASDNRSYAAAGFPAAGLASGAAHYHSPQDKPEHVDPLALSAVGRLLLAAVHLLADPSRRP